MSGRAAARRSPAPARPAPNARPRLRTAPAPARRVRRRSLPRAPLVMALVAALLLGIVWVNVSRLGLARETSAVIEESRAVQVDNARLEGLLEQRDGAVTDLARTRLGMTPAPSESVTYIDLPPASR